ncbi:germination protein YpeB [Heliorestis convoluta]|uniref:Germination protein YpeB n=1 Tax=Heliorestis convoluta TaxID=356322 RepID=A0A5Q2MWY9_9FIRM|nr:germination protein YpeB [Heliorestis convoluta]QGG46947.1 Germination protein YpeB [Heliorestis convoluta]
MSDLRENDHLEHEREERKDHEKEQGALRKTKNSLAFLAGILAITTIGLGLATYNQYTENRIYRMTTENHYQRAFMDLTGHVENMELEMSRVLVSNSPNQAVLGLTDVWRESSQAAADLGQLPMSTLLLSRTNEFVNQTGDFCLTLAQEKVDQNNALTPEEIRQLSELHKQTVFLRDELRKMSEQIHAGQLAWIDMEREARRHELQEGSQPQTALSMLWNSVVTAVAGQGPEAQAPAIYANFQFVEEELQKFTAVDYDGQYSSTIKVEPRGLGTGQITQEQALQIAQSFLGPDALEGHTLNVLGEGKATIEAYSIAASPENDPENYSVTMDISKQGGHVIWMLRDRPVGNATITRDQAARVAIDFMEEKGIRNLEATAVEQYSNMAVVTLVATEGDMSLYPDKIKVRVAMDNSEIVGYDATAYLTFHHNRNIPETRLSVDEARQRVSNQVEITGTNLALIAKENYTEVPCWEFRAVRGNQEYLIYINALNGKEEQIYRVINTEAGKFIF